ncbi:MAG TPA: SRPBCC family protein [Abditibacteriaceae bacterium]|nr:SRPBCC family protein [Abditibacteriaceae bacterium]
MLQRVESKITIRAPLESVWELAQDVEKMPDIMPDLDMVKVLEREVLSDTATRTVTEWHGRIKKFNRKIEWVEEDVWDADERTCRFHQLRGDFTAYNGEWRFREADGATVADLVVNFSFEIPLLGAVVRQVLKKLVQENSDTMLQCLRDEAERRAGH